MKPLLCLLLLSLLFPARPAHGDEKGTALLRELLVATQATPNLTAGFTIHWENRGVRLVRASGKFALKRPNFARVDATGGPKSSVVEDQTLVSDGKTLWTYLKDFKRCQRTPVERDGGNIMNWCSPVSIFFAPDHLRLYSELFDVSTRDLGLQNVEGESFRVLEIAPDAFDAQMTTYRLYLGSDHLIHRITEEFGEKSDRIKMETVLSHLQSDKTLSDALFRYSLPQNAHIVDIPVTDYDKGLLRVGNGTPGFRLSTPDGELIDQAEALKGHKALLVTFWFYGCGPCRAEFPGLQALYNTFHDKGLEIVAINNGDDAALVRRYRDWGKFTFPLALDPNGGKPNSLAAEYNVNGFPTAYLLDTNGTILWRSHTFDADAIRTVLKRQGVE